MKKLIQKINIFIITFSIPFMAFAQSNFRFDNGNAKTFVESVQKGITNYFIPFMVLLALLYVIYAVVEFIQANEDSRTREEKQQKIFWGLMGLFVIISVWALVAIVANSFGLFAGSKLTG